MEKLLSLTLSALLALSMPAYGDDINKEIKNMQESQEAQTELSNPFMECKTLEEAAKLAGFSFEVPESIEGMGKTNIMAIKGSLIQVFYQEAVVVRKAAGDRDISGDYNNYTETNLHAIGDLQVTMKGNQGKVYVAVWTTEKYSFAITAKEGMSKDTMVEMIQKLK